MAARLDLPPGESISTRSLIDTTFPDRLAALLREVNVPGELLCIEVTEHTLMTDPDTTIEGLRCVG